MKQSNSGTTIRLSLLASAMALALATTPARAQDNTTGLLKGSVSNEAGQQLSGVTIQLRHLGRNFTRSIQTSDQGEYVLRALPVGDYQVQVLKDGKVLMDDYVISISLGQAQIFAPVVQGNKEIERIQVTGAMLRRVDTADSTAGITLDDDILDLMPVNTGFENVALLTPGVARNSEFSASSFGGASSAENGYFLNGMNISALRTGIGSIDLPWEAIAQTQVKTGGISAEYGRFIGGVVNAVSKSGSNDFQFGAEVRHDPGSLFSAHDTQWLPSGGMAINNMDYESSFSEANLWLSGPILEDKLFFYALLNPRQYNSDYANSAGTQFTEHEKRDDRWFVTLDWNISDDHVLTLTALDNSADKTYDTFAWSQDAGKGQSTGQILSNEGGKMYSVRYQGFITDNFSLSATLGRVEDSSRNIPTNQFPGVWDYVNLNGERIGSWTTSNLIDERYQRDQFRLDMTYLLDDHSIQFGVDGENLTVNYLEYQNGVGDARGWWEYRNYVAIPRIGLPAGTYVRQRQRDAGGETEVNALAFYIQDSWQVNDNLVLNTGLRYSNFENTATTGESYAELDGQIAPRVQLIWDPQGDGSSKLFATLGRYFQPISANMNIKQASGQRDVHYYYEPGQLNADGTPVLGADGSPSRGALVATNQVQSGEVDVQRIAAQDLGPMYSDEVTLGYERELGDSMKGGVRFVYRDLKQSIEDSDLGPVVAQWLEENGVANNAGEYYFYTLLNPGKDVTFLYDFDLDGNKERVELSAADLMLPEPKRRYLAWEFNLEGRATEDLQLYASYVWSHSWGMTEGLVRTDNGQADPGWTTSYDYADLMDHGYGNLPNDHRHAFKLSGIYDLTENWKLGFVARATSGSPVNKFSIHPQDVDTCAQPSLWANWCASQWYDEASFYDWDGTPAPRGSAGNLDWLYELDLSLTYVTQVYGGDLSFKATVYNPFNFDTPINVNEVAQVTLSDGSFAANPDWNSPTGLQKNRFVSLVARYEF
ncbi:TonB-dependent receptor [Bowmanella dokdonensis]|uniref:TonB-dependent receptor n=1 Tax=Bowmanella dokdonensis TaxID=751969 RepID=A0A939IME7_9ALTE|nr:TonB-dependent receptor [Bowmanella dokdonensis]MBN7825238.1 TonB-dependent receptor [Bowmanella dokdonensis]